MQSLSLLPERICLLKIATFNLVGFYLVLTIFISTVLCLYLPHQPISCATHQPMSALHPSTNQHKLVSTSIAPLNTMTFVPSSHSSVIADKC